MAREQVRSASKTLGPLLRRRGTSPAVGSALRRAVQALDKALSAPDGQDSPEEIHRALAELRGCLVLIYESTLPADQEQLEGTAKALSFLAPLESELPPLEAKMETLGGFPNLPAMVRAAPSRARAGGRGRGLAVGGAAQLLCHSPCRAPRIRAPPSRSR